MDDRSEYGGPDHHGEERGGAVSGGKSVPTSNEPQGSWGGAALRSEQGFSLIEVTIALGLLATVLISIASLFIMGGKQVKNGKSTTTAAAISHEIMERIEQKAYTDTYLYFGGTDSSTSVSVNTFTSGNNATQWQAEIGSKLGPQAKGFIVVTPLGNASPLNMGNSQALQVRVTISWNELGRTKSVSLESIRF
jgi:type II secretory pathway pseudopilin PulG